MCRVHVMCQQLRLRDVSDVIVSLHCRTKPIIESSSNVQFCCWQIGWWGLQQQMHSADLSPFLNFWSDVHDFSAGSTTNWKFADEHTMRWPGRLHHQAPKVVAVCPGTRFPIAFLGPVHPHRSECQGHVEFLDPWLSKWEQWDDTHQWRCLCCCWCGTSTSGSCQPA